MSNILFTGDNAEEDRKLFKRLDQATAFPKFLQEQKANARREAEAKRKLKVEQHIKARLDELNLHIAHVHRSVDPGGKIDKKDAELLKELEQERGELEADLAAAREARKPRKLTSKEIARAHRAHRVTPPWRNMARNLAPNQRLVPAPVNVELGFETAHTALVLNRAEQDRVLDKLLELPKRSNSRAELKAQMRRDVARLAADGAPDVRRDLQWPSPTMTGDPTKQCAAMIAYLFMPQVIARLDAEIDERPEGITAEARAAKIKKLEAELLRLQRIEERLVCMCLDKGLDVERLPNRHALAFLECEIKTVSKKSQ